MLFVRNSCPSYPQFSLVPKVLSLPSSKDAGLSSKGKFSTQLQPSCFAYCIKATVTRAKNVHLVWQHCCQTSLKAMLHVLLPTFKSGFCKLRLVVPGRKIFFTKKVQSCYTFYQPKANLFCSRGRNSTPVYGVTPA